MALVLIHGGLWDDMNADRFWVRTGVVGALRKLGMQAVAPDRLKRADSWAADAARLRESLPDHPVTLVAGSNGCSSAVRLALMCPEMVSSLLLAWPATAGAPAVDKDMRQQLAEAGAPHVIEDLLAGEILRGVGNAELAALRARVGVLPSTIPNPVHDRSTVDALLCAIPGALELPAFPEPSRGPFARTLGRFAEVVVKFAVEA